jgi:hypothetical protein
VIRRWNNAMHGAWGTARQNLLSSMQWGVRRQIPICYLHESVLSVTSQFLLICLLYSSEYCMSLSHPYCFICNHISASGIIAPWLYLSHHLW